MLTDASAGVNLLRRPRRCGTRASAVDLEGVTGDGEAVVGGDPREPVLAVEEDVDGGTADLADEVVLVIPGRAGPEALLLPRRHHVGLPRGVPRGGASSCHRFILLAADMRPILSKIITLQSVYMYGLMDGVHTEDGLDRAAELFKVLGNESRLWLVRLLGNEQLNVGALTELTGMSQPLVSQHLKTLRQAGLVRAIRQGKAVTYVLADEHVTHIVADALVHVQELPRHPGA